MILRVNLERQNIQFVDFDDLRLLLRRDGHHHRHHHHLAEGIWFQFDSGEFYVRKNEEQKERMNDADKQIHRVKIMKV